MKIVDLYETQFQPFKWTKVNFVKFGLSRYGENTMFEGDHRQFRCLEGEWRVNTTLLIAQHDIVVEISRDKSSMEYKDR